MSGTASGASPATSILVVDDNVDNLTILVALLEHDHRVLVARTGERALALAAATPALDLILLDVMMPGMDGYTVIDRLRSDPGTRDIPVIFVTAKNLDEDELKGLNLGAVDYIVKPYRPDIVLSRVRAQLELKRARDQLRLHNAQLASEFESVLASTAEGIYGTDAQGVITFANPAAAHLLGYERADLVGRASHTMLGQEPDCGICPQQDKCPIAHACVHGTAMQNREGELARRDGSLLPVQFTCLPMVREGQLTGTVLAFNDMTERKRYQAELERKAHYDELTGLPNLQLLRNRLALVLQEPAQAQRPLALLALKLGQLQEIGDSLGRDMVELVLQQAVQRVLGVVPGADTVARAGGDELLILHHGDALAPQALAQLLLEQFAQVLHIEGRHLFLTAHVGIALHPGDGRTGPELQKNAMAAMSQALATGQAAFCFYEAQMGARSLSRLELTNDLRRGLERGEFALHYQPQVSLLSGAIIGVEALIRWRHPQRGLLCAAEFIQVAEDTGLIVPMGEWVLQAACRQIRLWRDAGVPTVPVAVNLSARQFVAQDLPALVDAALRDNALDPACLELELTESAMMSDLEIFGRTTKRLKQLGVALSIDDFGTGFSSLSYLKRFDVDRLKIDASFVRDITQDANSVAIVRAIISLAHNLKLSVIAEGVENEAQLTFLRASGCDEIQGYHFSKPLPAPGVQEMLQRQIRLALPALPELPQRTLLVVDDDAAVRSALRRALRGEGYDILFADCGETALELLASHRVQVVISDMRMARMTGAELLRKIRRIHPRTMRILLSGYTDIRAVTEAVNAGELFRFLTKPWDNQELMATVEEAFREYEAKHGVLSPAARSALPGLGTPSGLV
ncbi:MAG: EAL domain-containing protein [Rhodoferax sp.]